MEMERLPAFDLIDNPKHFEMFSTIQKRAACCEPMDGFRELLAMARSRKATDTNQGVNVGDMCSVPLLTKDQEQYLFRWFIALKHSANFVASRPNVKDAKQHYDKLCARIKEVKEVIFMCNIRLLVNFLKTKRFKPETFALRFSDGCTFMAHAIDKFDFVHGWKFSTYCIWALIRNFSVGRKGKREQFEDAAVCLDPDAFYGNYDRPAQNCEVDADAIYEEQRARIIMACKKANVDERSIQVICESLGLFTDKKTLNQIAETMPNEKGGVGVSKERVRQIKVKGIQKLRKLLCKNRKLLEAV